MVSASAGLRQAGGPLARLSFNRHRFPESVEFEAAPAVSNVANPLPRPRSPILSVIRSHPAEILLAGGAFVANNTCFYIAITYVVAYATTTLHLPRDMMLVCIMTPALIGSGWVSDHWGRRRPFILGAALTGFWAFAFFPLIATGLPWAVGVAIAVELVLISLMYGPQAALFAELFPVEVRYSGASLGYQLGSVVGGGFAPIIATALFAEFGSSFPISVYLFVMCAISLAWTAMLSVRAPPPPAGRWPMTVRANLPQCGLPAMSSETHLRRRCSAMLLSSLLTE